MTWIHIETCRSNVGAILVIGYRIAGPQDALAAIAKDAVEKAALEVRAVGNTKVRSKVVPVGIVGLTARRQTLELCDWVCATARTEEMIQS